MKKIRKVIIGKEPVKDAMHYELNKTYIGGKYKISDIIDNDESIIIYISHLKTNEMLVWKEISKNTAWIIEYSQDI